MRLCGAALLKVPAGAGTAALALTSATSDPGPGQHWLPPPPLHHQLRFISHLLSGTELGLGFSSNEAAWGSWEEVTRSAKDEKLEMLVRMSGRADLLSWLCARRPPRAEPDLGNTLMGEWKVLRSCCLLHSGISVPQSCPRDMVREGCLCIWY